MANHVSAAKRARQRFGRTARNRLIQGALRSSLKRARAAISGGNTATAQEIVAAATRTAARAASKGVLHRNAAARLSSRLQRALNKLSAGSWRGGRRGFPDENSWRGIPEGKRRPCSLAALSCAAAFRGERSNRERSTRQWHEFASRGVNCHESSLKAAQAAIHCRIAGARDPSLHVRGGPFGISFAWKRGAALGIFERPREPAW